MEKLGVQREYEKIFGFFSGLIKLGSCSFLPRRLVSQGARLLYTLQSLKDGACSPQGNCPCVLLMPKYSTEHMNHLGL